MVDGLEFFNALAASARGNEHLKSEFPDLEKQLNSILSSLKEVADKFKEGYAIKDSESAMLTLHKFMVDAALRAREQEARSKALHDMAEAMIPQVTDAQMQAYRAQKQAYDAHEKELKAQTDAIVKAANAQTKAVQREADAQIKIAAKEAEKKDEAIDRQIANEKKREAQIAESLKKPLSAGESLSKIDGKDTLLTQVFSGLRGALEERKAQDDKAIAEAFAPQKEAIQIELAARKEAIQEELAERKKAIEEERDAQIAATKETMAAIAREQGIVKAEDPRKLREAQVAQIAGEASRLKGIENAAPGAIAAEVRSEGAQGSPLPTLGSALVESIAPKAEVATPMPAAPASPLAGGKGAGPLEGLGGISKAMGSLIGVVGKFQPMMMPLVQIAADLDNTLPVISLGVGAIADASRLLGSTLFSIFMDLGGYLIEGLHAISEAITIGDTRQEDLEESGAIQKERDKLAAARKAEEEELRKAMTADLTAGSLSVTGKAGTAKRTLTKVEPAVSTPVEEQRARAASQEVQGPAKETATSLERSTQQMIEAQERAARRQAQVGLGTTPLVMSNPCLEPFPA